MSNEAVTVVREYFGALMAKDFDGVGARLSGDVVWHQPGANRFSGTHDGGAAVNEMIGGMMAVSEGTFELALLGEPMVNGDLVAANVRFGGKREGASMLIDGIDLLRVTDGKITEVWLFSEDQQAEDDFWGQAS